MTDDVFEKLKQIAKEQFGCTIVRSNEKMDFKQIFGFDEKDLEFMKENENGI